MAYDPGTGVLTWKVDAGGRGCAGEAAGTFSDGYTLVCIDYRIYRAHRLAWFIVYGRWPEKQLDHVNGRRDDNRLANLREATDLENARNRTKQKNNSSGFKGVTFYKARSKWRAQIVINGRYKHIGLFASPEAAHEAYVGEAERHFGEFAKG